MVGPLADLCCIHNTHYPSPLVGTAKRERQKQNRAERRVIDARRYRTSLIKRRILKWGGIITAIILGALLLVTFTGDDEETVTLDSSTTSFVTRSTGPGMTVEGETPCPKTDGTENRTITFAEAPPLCIDPAKSYTAKFITSEGDIVIELDTTNTPNTANNFITLARYQFYNGTTFFRTDPSIDIIQGGGEDNNSGPGYTITDEGSGYTYKEGDFVMARTAAKDSAGSQFFFVTGPNAAALDSQGTYVVFGKVTSGLDVLKQIMDLHVDLNNGLGGRPFRDVIVNSVDITES